MVRYGSLHREFGFQALGWDLTENHKNPPKITEQA
jgi:hypothetical protein